MDLSKFEESIIKTGFDLEYQVSEILRKNKWTVINNKYYVDDVQQTVREIDLIAYKTTTIESIIVYTALVISCKKNEEHVWGLLAKEKNIKDPNTNWHPISNWSNNKTLEYMLTENKWSKDYLEIIKEHNLYTKLIEPQNHIFAFQEMHKSRGTPKNDKSIFASISSLMKAEGYEIESLSKRKKKDCLYNFNLISVAETELVKLFFNDNGVTATIVDDDKYIGSYIINNNDVQSRIHFINSNKLKDLIKDYNNLHNANSKFCTKLISNFYKDAIKVKSKRELYNSAFIKKIKWQVYKLIPDGFKVGLSEDDYCMHYNKSDDILEISFSGLFTNPNESELIINLNNDSKLNVHIRKALKEIYRFEGDFRFIEDFIPF